ncbi:MAG: glycosyltransferase [Acidobacteriia bacterium]|nr:glycosyltransferase [Terriglobia bacterium]
MKVLLLGPYPPPHGGVQTNLVAIRAFLLKQGMPCAVINITRHRKPDAEEVYYPKSAVQLLGLLARLPYDVLHLHIGGMLTRRLLSLSLACTLRPGTKSVMTFHSGGFPSTPEGQALGPASFAGFVLRRFDGVIGVNEEIVSFLHKVGVRPNRVRCISPYAFLPKDESADLLPPHLASFLEEHDPVLLSVGLLEPEYDLALQIDILPLVRQKSPDAGLLLIGSGSLEAHLRAKIDASPSAQHILLAGDVPHAATMEAVLRARLMLRTTLYDGDALSVREALQLGTPVIATDNGMRPAGVRLIPKSDSQSLLRAIDEALQHPAEQKEQTGHDESNLQAVFDFYRDLMDAKVG